MIPTDPDVLFLRWGGFIHYDSNGSILNVMVMSRIDQKYFIQYGEPEPLHPDDVKRFLLILFTFIYLFINLLFIYFILIFF